MRRTQAGSHHTRHCPHTSVPRRPLGAQNRLLGAGAWVFLVKNRGRFGTPYTRLAAASCGLTHTVAHMTRLHVSVRRMHLVECQCVQAYMSQETPMPYTRQPTLPCHNTLFSMNTYTSSMQTLLFCNGPNTRSTTPGLLQLQQTMGGSHTPYNPQ